MSKSKAHGVKDYSCRSGLFRVIVLLSSESIFRDAVPELFVQLPYFPQCRFARPCQGIINLVMPAPLEGRLAFSAGNVALTHHLLQHVVKSSQYVEFPRQFFDFFPDFHAVCQIATRQISSFTVNLLTKTVLPFLLRIVRT